MSSTSIAGRVALVTGANRGIGRALTRELIQRGAKRVYATARNIDGLGGLVTEFGEQVAPVVLDVTHAGQVAAAAERARDVDLLINNAGIAELGGRWADPGLYEASQREIAVNVGGTIAITQALPPPWPATVGGCS